MGMFVFLLLISKYLHVLENNLLSDVSFVNIFLPASGLFSHTLNFFFCFFLQKKIIYTKTSEFGTQKDLL